MSIFRGFLRYFKNDWPVIETIIEGLKCELNKANKDIDFLIKQLKEKDKEIRKLKVKILHYPKQHLKEK